MARPLRDFPTETARSGDATRAFSRFGDGSDWLQAGVTALERAGGDITRVIAERVDQSNKLEDATARSEAIQKTRTRLDERLRPLDPRSPEYQSEVERIVAETTEGVVSETNWRSSATRDQFRIDAAQLRTQAVLGAADRREQAVVNAAKDQVSTSISRAVAAIALSPGSRDLQLLNLENEIGPILQNVRPEVRDALIKQARETTAEEAARGFVINRNFAAAEQALKTYGAQGLLSPTAVRQIRAGMEVEKRQAAAESRTRLREATADVRAFFLEGDVAGGQRALDQALESGIIPRGSPQHNLLVNAARNAEARSRDRGTERLAEAVGRIQDGVGTPADDRALAASIMQEERKAADERLIALGPEAANDATVRDREYAVAAQRASERTIRTLLDIRPDKTPAVLSQMVETGARTNDDGQRSATGELLGRLHSRNPAAVEDALRNDPVLGVVMDDLRASGQALSRQNIAQRLSLMPREARNTEDWTRATGGSTPSVRPEAFLAAAAERLVPSDETREATTPAQLGAMRDDFRRAWLAGMPPEQAADFATRRMLGQTHVSQAGTRPVRLNRESAPASYFPPDLVAQYGQEFVERQIGAQVAGQVATALGVRPAEVTRDYDIVVTAIPAISEGQRRIAYVAAKVHKRNGVLTPVEVRPGEPWRYIVPVGDPAAVAEDFNRSFNLAGERNRLQRTGGISPETETQAAAAQEAIDANNARNANRAANIGRGRDAARERIPSGSEQVERAIQSLDPGPEPRTPEALTNQPVGQNLQAPSARRVIDTLRGRTP